MAETTETVNPSWEQITVELATSLRRHDIYLTYEVKNIIDDYAKGIMAIVNAAAYEYIVVSGTPSEELDENGRKEISAGNSITDSRLENRYVTLMALSVGTRNPQAFDKPNASDTLQMLTVDQFRVGDIISLFTR